jgi:hypothetical protein
MQIRALNLDEMAPLIPEKIRMNPQDQEILRTLIRVMMGPRLPDQKRIKMAQILQRAGAVRVTQDQEMILKIEEKTDQPVEETMTPEMKERAIVDRLRNLMKNKMSL